MTSNTLSRSAVALVASGALCASVLGSTERIGTPGENPLLGLLADAHPLGDTHARRRGGISGTSGDESVRLLPGGDGVSIHDGQGRVLRRVAAGRAVGGFGLHDVDGDDVLEVLMRLERDPRLLAFDYFGNRRRDLDEKLSALAIEFEQIAIASAVELQYRQPADRKGPGGIAVDPAGAPLDDSDACDAMPGPHIEWNGEMKQGRRYIEGTPGNDVIVGTNGDDLIVGLGGADTVCAREGDDWVYGDAQDFDGAPTPGAVAGNDFLFAGPGDDNVFGGPGNDLMYAGDGNDNLFGGHGNDFLYGDGGGYFALPESNFGQDFLVGMWGDDDVHGGAGSDTVNATAFDDVETESGFAMGFPEGIDNCHVHINEIVAAANGGCESVFISDW